MISSLDGVVAEIGPGWIELDVGGVGYHLYVSSRTINEISIGVKVRIATHLVAREDSLSLFGFVSKEERATFNSLITVTGVGPKLALSILSAFDPATLRKAVVAEDVGAITGVPGVGKRTAQRIVLELKDKLGADTQSVGVMSGSKIAEVREALIALGYSPSELREIVDLLPDDGQAQVEDLMRAALKELSRA